MNKYVVKLKNAKFVETVFEDGSKQLVGVVQGDSFLNTDIPTNPNPRQFLGDGNPNYKDMVKTLKTEPQMFARKNSAGITIFATSYTVDENGDYIITLFDNDGIANGGHTYNALRVYGKPESQVKVTIEIQLKRELIVDIANALNNHKKLLPETTLDMGGFFNWHKLSLEEKSMDIVYHEGDKGIISVKEAISMLNLFKPNFDNGKIDARSNIEESEHQSASLLNSMSSDSENAKLFKNYLQPIAKDVHELTMFTLFDEEMVEKLKENGRLFGKSWTKKNRMIKGIATLLIGGLAHVGVELKEDSVVWKKKYNNIENRKAFIKNLLSVAINGLSAKVGTASTVVRMDEVREEILRYSEAIDKTIKVKRK